MATVATLHRHLLEGARHADPRRRPVPVPRFRNRRRPGLMCGIAGYFGPGLLDAARLDGCVALMRRRGPDAAGWRRIETGGPRNLYLLYSRLAIIDLDPRSDQPFGYGPLTLIYNGELYNYIELRTALRAEGWRFRTGGDTEVFAALAAARGIDGLDDGEGMWGAAWWDRDERRLVLARDRFGEKPVYLLQDEAGLWFGSEIKLIAALRGVRPPVDHDHVRRYLVNGYKSLYKRRGGRVAGFFQGIEELAPASAASFAEDGTRRDRVWWHPSRRERDDGMRFEEAVEGARAALMLSVRRRLRADVPLAFCLSGGVDSNALIAIARRGLGREVHGFTIVNTDARYEEAEMVAASVRELGLRHTAIPIDSTGFLPRLRELIRYHDAPVYTIAHYAQWRLMAAVAEAGFRVAVSGTGADELFSGYFDHHLAYLHDLHHEAGMAAWQRARRDWQRLVRPIVRNPFLRDPDYFLNRPEARDHIFLNADRFALLLHGDWREAFTETRYCDGLLRNRMANELFEEVIPVILHEEDLNAMYWSVENRSPYLDRGLWDWCQRIPTRHLVRGGRAKSVLREAARGLAPDMVLDNPRKVGFNAPIADYLDLADASVRAQILDDGPIFDLVRRDGVEALLRKRELPNSESKFLMNFVCARIFLEEFAA